MMRVNFVDNVMADVPVVDFKSTLHEIVLDDTVAQLPPTVRAVWDDPKTRTYIYTDGYYLGANLGSTCVPCADDDNGLALTVEAARKFQVVLAQHEAQGVTRSMARSSLLRVVAQANTVERLAELLPDLVQYMPNVSTGDVDTRAVRADEITAALKALGWPKGKTDAVADVGAKSEASAAADSSAQGS